MAVLPFCAVLLVAGVYLASAAMYPGEARLYAGGGGCYTKNAGSRSDGGVKFTAAVAVADRSREGAEHRQGPVFDKIKFLFFCLHCSFVFQIVLKQ